jgi:hypothetical protein
MGTELTRREATAAVILRNMVQHFTATQRGAVSMAGFMSRVPPLERDNYGRNIEGLKALKMVGEQDGEIFVTQYGQLFLEYAIPTAERRDLPLTSAERAEALSLLVLGIKNDARFDTPDEAPPTQPPARQVPAHSGDPGKFWLGAAIMGLIALSFLYQVLKRV